MGVVFDHVVGEVEPETGGRPTEEPASGPRPLEPGPEKMRRDWRRLMQREARLCAD